MEAAASTCPKSWLFGVCIHNVPYFRDPVIGEKITDEKILRLYFRPFKNGPEGHDSEYAGDKEMTFSAQRAQLPEEKTAGPIK